MITEETMYSERTVCEAWKSSKCAFANSIYIEQMDFPNTENGKMGSSEQGETRTTHKEVPQ